MPSRSEAHETSCIKAWLHKVRLQEYVPNFEHHHITPTTLLTLTTQELQTMGINPLKHRRKLLAEIRQQRQQPFATQLTGRATTDGRILTDLSSQALFLTWARISILLQTTATVSLRLRATKPSTTYVTICAGTLATASILVLLHAVHQLRHSRHVTERAASERMHAQQPIILPMLLTAVITLLTLHALMADRVADAEAGAEAVLLLLLSC